jgi:hypothetical protein
MTAEDNFAFPTARNFRSWDAPEVSPLYPTCGRAAYHGGAALLI